MKNITFTGAGAIAEAIINGLISDGVCLPGQLVVTNHSNDERLSFLKESYGVSVTRDKREAVKHADIIILAMKPKDVRSGIESIREHVTGSQLIISVLAGISTETIQDLFGKKLSVIRAMPNTSAAIRKSATALACTPEVSRAELDAASELFRAIGTVVHVSENQLDAVTGLSGSGPAYIYYLAEALEAAAADNGIEAHTAKALIAQTLLGAAEMLLHSGKQPEVLRKEVTSPGGTTEAGIARLEHYAVKKALRECVKTATERSAEMGELFAKNAQREHT